MQNTNLWRRISPLLNTEQERQELLAALEQVRDTPRAMFTPRANDIAGAFVWSHTAQGQAYWLRWSQLLRDRAADVRAAPPPPPPRPEPPVEEPAPAPRPAGNTRFAVRIPA